MARNLGLWRAGSSPAVFSRSARVAALAAAWLAGSGVARGQCPEWSVDFGPIGFAGPDGSVLAMVEHDDGSGPSLYLGGEFTGVPGIPPVNGIVRWSGVDWSPVASGFDGSVLALAVFDDGSGPKLFAGGAFSDAGGVAVGNVARWDGSSWAALGAGLDERVEALAVFDDGTGPALYAGGEFQSAGGLPASHVARWNGVAWSDVGGGMDKLVSALEVFDDGSGPALYAGGKFKLAGGVSAVRVARWNGSAWSNLGTGVNGPVQALRSFQGELYVGGLFSKVGGKTTTAIGRWNGTQWKVLANGGLSGGVSALTVFDDGSGPALFVGGAFGSTVTYPLISLRSVARWDGSAWYEATPGITGQVEALAAFDEGQGPALFAGGSVQSGGTAKNFLRWKGAWSEVGPVGPGAGGVDSKVSALAVHDAGGGSALFATGDFLEAGGIPANLIARWDGVAWSTLGSGLGSNAGIFEDGLALASWNDGSGPVLVAGGQFPSAGGSPANNVASWDGVGWSALAGGLTGTAYDVKVNALTVWDDGAGPALYAAGKFTLSGKTRLHRVAKWDGSIWTKLGKGLAAEALALAAHADASGSALYVGGTFLKAGGAPASHVARWDGASWSALGAGVDGDVEALVSHGGSLYAGGSFSNAGGAPASRIARWDGTAWSAVGTGLQGEVDSLFSYDDGSGGGPALHAGGYVVLGTSAVYLARWEGSSWTAVAGGLNGPALAMTELQDGTGWPALFVGGFFSKAGVQLSENIASLSNECACQGTAYCTAGTTASGCSALIASSGAASASAGAGFDLSVAGVEGGQSGVIFFSTNGAQAVPWGNGSSFLCVVPPFVRTGTLPASGMSGACDGGFQLDFNAWMAAHQNKAPAAGDTAYLQCWFRDPQSTSNQPTSLSNALRASVCP